MNYHRRCALIFENPNRRRGMTLIEVLIAIALITIIFVFITGDLTNLTNTGRVADRTIEISASDYLLGVMKSDPNFWQTDWQTGPGQQCLAALGPYTDAGPGPNATWHSMPSPAAGCSPLPFTDQGAPQPVASNATPAPPVGDTIQYMWNVAEHQGDPFAADLVVWVRRDASSPFVEYHSLRYEWPGSNTPTPTPAPTPTTPPPTSTPTSCPNCTPPPPTPTPKPTPPHSPTPKPSPTPVGV